MKSERYCYFKFSDHEFMEFGIEQGHVGKTYTELMKTKEGKAYYRHAVHYRKKIFDKLFTKDCSICNKYSILSDEEIIELAKKEGHAGKTYSELQKTEAGRSFYRHVVYHRKHIMDRIFSKEISASHKYSKLSDEEIIELAKKEGHVGKTHSELMKTKEGKAYYDHVRMCRRHIFDKLFNFKKNDFFKLSDEEIIKLAEERGYAGKTHSELMKMKNGRNFYDHLYKHRKNIFDRLFREKKLIESISSTIKSNPKLAEHLVKVCHGDESDIADVLAVVYDAPRERVLNLLRKPGVKKYLGETSKKSASSNIVDVGYAAQALYDKYKDKIILEKLKKTLRNYSRERLGPMPKDEDFDKLVNELEGVDI